MKRFSREPRAFGIGNVNSAGQTRTCAIQPNSFTTTQTRSVRGCHIAQRFGYRKTGPDSPRGKRSSIVHESYLGET